MTAYREAAAAPCHKCDRPAAGDCGCCRKPTCARHVDAQRMCGTCDEAYYTFMRQGDDLGVWFVFVMVLLCVGLGAVRVPALLPFVLPLPFVGLPLMAWWRKRRRRAAFFRIMRERGALPVPPPDGDDDEHALARYEQQQHERHLAAFEHANDVDDGPAR